MKRVAVTGSNGFIGRHVVPVLLQNGYEVVEISRCKGFDITDWKTIENIPCCNAIIHLAAKTFVPDSFTNPKAFYDVNITATINALELARKWGAKVIYMSSYFYGIPQYTPIDEKHPIQPHNPYAQTKWVAEQLCAAYSRDFGVSAIALRLFNIYGPGQTESFLIPEILNKIKIGKLKLKDPRPKRDYIHVFDVAKAIRLCLDKGFCGFDVFNLSTGVSYSVAELLQIIYKYSNVKFEIEYSHEYRKGEVLDSVGNPSKLQAFLGFENFIKFELGIKSLIN